MTSKVPEPLKNTLNHLVHLSKIAESLNEARWSSRNALVKRAKEIGMSNDDLILFLWENLPRQEIRSPASNGIRIIHNFPHEFYEHVKLVYNTSPPAVASHLADQVLTKHGFSSGRTTGYTVSTCLDKETV